MSPVHMDKYSLISTMLGLPNGILKFSSLLSILLELGARHIVNSPCIFYLSFMKFSSFHHVSGARCSASHS